MLLWSVNGEKEDIIIRIGYSSWAATNLLQMFESKERWWNCGWKMVCGKGFWFWCVGFFFCFYGRGLFGFEDEGESSTGKGWSLKKQEQKTLMDLNVVWRNTKAWDPEKSWRGNFCSWRKCVSYILKLTGRDKERSRVGWLVRRKKWWNSSLVASINYRRKKIIWLMMSLFISDLRAKKEGREEVKY